MNTEGKTRLIAIKLKTPDGEVKGWYNPVTHEVRAGRHEFICREDEAAWEKRWAEQRAAPTTLDMVHDQIVAVDGLMTSLVAAAGEGEAVKSSTVEAIGDVANIQHRLAETLVMLRGATRRSER